MDAFCGFNELAEPKFYRKLLGELIGTFVLVAVAISSCSTSSSYTPEVTQIAFTFGILVYTLAKVLTQVSGCHINPAISLSFLVVGEMSVVSALFYIVVQCIGAIGGAAVVDLAVARSVAGPSFGVTKPHTNLQPHQAFLIEMLITCLLVLVVKAVSDRDRREMNESASLAIGVAIAAGHLCAVKLTGSSMNPARSLGPAVIHGDWKHHWVYWAGPITGAVVAALIYRVLFKAPYYAVRIEEPTRESMQSAGLARRETL